ncbi:MAG: cysteine hydrolase [Alphaproteobacteria bacterium]|nr:MAG: cysteine hydrolase [Alphaproteobacteria bacterium]
MTAALVILDMINLFDFEGGKALAAQAKRIVKPIKDLRTAFTARGLPVIFANDNFLNWNRDFKELVATCTHPSSSGSLIAEELRPAPSDYYVLKPKHSAFLCTALPAILRDLQVDRLVLTGIATDSCVLMTAQDAHMREYKIVVPADCVAAQTKARSNAALRLMQISTNIDTSSSTTILRRIDLA